MSYRLIVAVAVAACAVLAMGCQQVDSAAEKAGDVAADGAQKAGDVAETVAADAESVTGDLMKKAEEVAGNLDAEARKAYDSVTADLASKQAELVELKDKIASMKPTDLLSGEGKKLKDRAASLNEEIGALQQKLKDLVAKAG